MLIEESEYHAFRKIARAESVTVPEWVRQALRSALRRLPTRDVERKLEIIRVVAAYQFPTDMPQIFAEIERGYLGADSR